MKDFIELDLNGNLFIVAPHKPRCHFPFVPPFISHNTNLRLSHCPLFDAHDFYVGGKRIWAGIYTCNVRLNSEQTIKKRSAIYYKPSLSDFRDIINRHTRAKILRGDEMMKKIRLFFRDPKRSDVWEALGNSVSRARQTGWARQYYDWNEFARRVVFDRCVICGSTGNGFYDRLPVPVCSTGCLGDYLRKYERVRKRAIIPSKELAAMQLNIRVSGVAK